LKKEIVRAGRIGYSSIARGKLDFCFKNHVYLPLRHRSYRQYRARK